MYTCFTPALHLLPRPQARQADELKLLFPLSFFACGRCRRFLALCWSGGSGGSGGGGGSGSSSKRAAARIGETSPAKRARRTNGPIDITIYDAPYVPVLVQLWNLLFQFYSEQTNEKEIDVGVAAPLGRLIESAAIFGASLELYPGATTREHVIFMQYPEAASAVTYGIASLMMWNPVKELVFRDHNAPAFTSAVAIAVRQLETFRGMPGETAANAREGACHLLANLVSNFGAGIVRLRSALGDTLENMMDHLFELVGPSRFVAPLDQNEQQMILGVRESYDHMAEKLFENEDVSTSIYWQCPVCLFSRNWDIATHSRCTTCGTDRPPAPADAAT